MSTKIKFQPEDIEFLLLNKEYLELDADEREFVSEFISTEEEYLLMRGTLQSITQAALPEVEVVPSYAIKDALMAEFEQEGRRVGAWWGNLMDTLFPAGKSIVGKPGVQMVFLACSVLLIALWIPWSTLSGESNDLAYQQIKGKSDLVSLEDPLEKNELMVDSSYIPIDRRPKDNRVGSLKNQGIADGWNTRIGYESSSELDFEHSNTESRDQNALNNGLSDAFSADTIERGFFGSLIEDDDKFKLDYQEDAVVEKSGGTTDSYFSNYGNTSLADQGGAINGVISTNSEFGPGRTAVNGTSSMDSHDSLITLPSNNDANWLIDVDEAAISENNERKDKIQGIKKVALGKGFIEGAKFKKADLPSQTRALSEDKALIKLLYTAM